MMPSQTKQTRSMSPATPSNIAKHLIGTNHTMRGPFGKKPIIYADSTASGKSLSFIEDYIRDCVLPTYANTHTEASATGRQTTRFREEARGCISRALNAPSSEYAVVFTGSGSTGAIQKLAHVTGIARFAATRNASKRPVVLIGPMEHHSNELAWRESNVDVVVISLDLSTGTVNMEHLERELIDHANRPFVLGSFSAASNVTGICSDVKAIASLLHKHGAFAAFDYAAAGPHLGIDMNGYDLDAIYLSPHKFAGGPGTPGLLVARRSLFTNRVPVVPGGGTVFWVQPNGRHYYLDDIEAREEGGTPAIVESIRAGLVLQLHSQVGTDFIELQEEAYWKRAVSTWRKNPKIAILGGTDAKRVSIVSFLIESPIGSRYLHFNFVIALLNDLFGIQSRGGCSCAGPYGHFLLDMNTARSNALLRELRNGEESVRPGWTRINFSYYMAHETVDYIIAAVDLIAKEGYKLLPWYRLAPESGSWTYLDYEPKSLALWNGTETYAKPKESTEKDLHSCLQQARTLLATLDLRKAPQNKTLVSAAMDRLRNFAVTEDLFLDETEDGSTAEFFVSDNESDSDEFRPAVRNANDNDDIRIIM